MKNIFKLMGIALIAGSLFVACKDDPEDPANETPTYTITAEVNSAVMGSVTGAGQYKEGETCTLTAIANPGHRFVQWQDANTSNPRVFTVTEDATYTATFEVETGLKVTFGTTVWDAQYINAQYSASQDAMVIAATSTTASDSYPQIVLGMETIAEGTVTGTPDINFAESTASRGNPYLWYFTEADRCYITLGGVQTGDWWDKTVTVNVTAFDATNLTISLVANATMGDFIAAFENNGDWAGTETCDMTIQATNLSLSAAKGASIFSKATQLARR